MRCKTGSWGSTSGLFYGEFSSERVQIPIACWLVRTSDAMILYDTAVARAVPGLCATNRWALHRRGSAGAPARPGRLEAENVDMVILSHLHYDHAGGAAMFPKSELVVQRTSTRTRTIRLVSSSRSTTGELRPPGYAGACWTATPSSCRRDGAAERRPHAGHQSLLVELPESGPVILAATRATGTSTPTRSACPAWCGNPTLALHSIKKSKRSPRLVRAAFFRGTTRSSGTRSSRRRMHIATGRMR